MRDHHHRLGPRTIETLRRRLRELQGLAAVMLLLSVACSGPEPSGSVTPISQAQTSGVLHSPGTIVPDQGSPPDPAGLQPGNVISNDPIPATSCPQVSPDLDTCSAGFHRVICPRGNRPNRGICKGSGEFNPRAIKAFCCK
jgi:hypothetical protein